MRKLYCDRCGKNTEMLHMVDMPDKPTGTGSFAIKRVELCSECKTFVDKAAKTFNEAMVATRISFYEMLLAMPRKEEGLNEDS